MIQLIFRIKDNDVYPIVIYPHQNRDLKKNEKLIFETENIQEFEQMLKDISKNCIRLHGEVSHYIDQ
jgi:tyrosine-protein phosphatase YwqE